jgi:2-polyprenyl-3-methyl-5-hydroxy-6-metoxy-1,4-benzoquinol methylase
MNYQSPLKTDVEVKYDDTPRMDVVDLIAHPPTNVLEIGCAAGATGLFVKKRFPGCRYTGIELDPGFCATAATRLDRCIQCNLDEAGALGRALDGNPFDLVICADVLEHLYDPWRILHELLGLMSPGGTLIASLPNLQHISVLQEIVDGRFRYQPHGLLDATHIRFFTRKEIFELFRGTGWTIECCVRKMTGSVPDNRFPTHVLHGRIQIRDVTREEAEDFLTFQYLIRAKPGRSAGVAA